MVDIETLYNANDNINARTRELKVQKEEIDGQIEEIRLSLELALRNTDTNSEALKNAKEELAVALLEKQDNDKEIEQLLYSNLDIIRSVQGQGNYNFDATKITQIVGFNIENLDFTNIYPLNHINTGEESCSADVIFYGIGKIQAVAPGQITIVNSAGDSNVLHTPDCSINMATQEDYTPKQGDAICWKGHRVAGRWVISESIVIPARVPAN